MHHGQGPLDAERFGERHLVVDAKALDEKTVYLRETLTALRGPGERPGRSGREGGAAPGKAGLALPRHLGSQDRRVANDDEPLAAPRPGKQTLSLPDLISDDADVARAFSAIADACSAVEMTYMTKMPFSP